jgi:transposase
MYLRHATVHKNGKTHTYWRLVRSVRHGSKVRQEVVAHLGELDAEGRAKASALARHFLGPRFAQQELFNASPPVAPTEVRLDQLRVERGRGFGDVWLAWTLWRALKLDEFCEHVLPQGREIVPWAQIASILVIARLCAPSSELQIAEDWYRRTALEDLLGIEPIHVHHRRLYEGLDQLLPHKRELEVHLKERLGEMFDLKYDLLLYDVTSTYFEGEALCNTLAKRGYSRDHRPDCKQVCIALVVTRDGMPLGYMEFAGNTTDVTTVEKIVTEMEARHGKADRVWVMDRGMISAKNLEWLKAGGRHYLIGTPKSELKKWQQQIVEREGWQTIREELEVKLCKAPDGEELFILCRSEDRRKKEEAMHDRFSKRIADGLRSLCSRLESTKRPEDKIELGKQIGRLLGKNSRAAAKFDIHVIDDPSRPAGLRVEWQENKAWSEWATLSEGTYILRTNVTNWSAEELWRTYVQLSEAEAAFRIQKSDLRIRPVWHQKTERVQAHILVCFLGYVLWKTLQMWQRRAGLGDSPRTVLEEMARIQSVDVVLPLATGAELKLRCVVRPDSAQHALLARLGLVLPSRIASKKVANVVTTSP